MSDSIFLFIYEINQHLSNLFVLSLDQQKNPNYKIEATTAILNEYDRGSRHSISGLERVKNKNLYTRTEVQLDMRFFRAGILIYY